MFPITCNAVGDIIAVVQLAGALVAALNDSTGSTAEYRSFANEIRSLHSVLKYVASSTEYLQALEQDASTQNICYILVREISRCCLALEQASKVIARYRASLGHGGSGGAWAKVRWRFFTQSRIAPAKAKIFEHQQTIATILTSILIRKMTNMTGATARSNTARDAFHQEAIGTIQESRQSIVAMLSEIIATLQSVPGHVGYSKANAVTLTDILGGVLVLPLELCYTWAKLHATLLVHFSDKAGSTFIQSRAYEVAHVVTPRKSSMISPEMWDAIVQCGTDLEMIAILHGYEECDAPPEGRSRCPRCKEGTRGIRTRDDGWMTCPHCSLCFQANGHGDSDANRPLEMEQWAPSYSSKTDDAAHAANAPDGDTNVIDYFRKVHLMLVILPPPLPVKKAHGADRMGPQIRRFPCPRLEEGCKSTFTRLNDAVRHATFSCKRNPQRLSIVCPVCKKNLSRPDTALRHQKNSHCQGAGEIVVLLEHAKVVLAVEETIVTAVARAEANCPTKKPAPVRGLDVQDECDNMDYDSEEE